MNTIVITSIQLLYFVVHFEKGDGGLGGGGRGAGGDGRGEIIGYDIDGKTLTSINHGSSYVYSTRYQRYYFYGSRYYKPQRSSGNAVVCKYEIDPYDEFFNMTYEDDGTRVVEVVYECEKHHQHCCKSLDCCDIERIPWLNLIFLVGGIVLFGGFCIYCAQVCSEELAEIQDGHAEDANHPTLPTAPPFEYNRQDTQTHMDVSHTEQMENPFFRNTDSLDDVVLPTYAQANIENPPPYPSTKNSIYFSKR